MKLWEIVLILVGVDAIAAMAMLRIRRGAPSRSFYKETQLAAGGVSVAGTIFAVLVGFVFLLAFQSYERARSSAQDEAAAVLGLFHIAGEFPSPEGDDLQQDVTCYGQAVAQTEWPAMEDHHSSPLVDAWLSRIAHRFGQVDIQGSGQAAAEQDWFTETDALQEARRARLAEAPRVVPAAIWLPLIALGLGVIGFVLLFADPRELRVAQLMMITAVTTGIAASLLIVNFLDRPYGDHEGAIQPTAMQEALGSIDREQGAPGAQSVSRCDTVGNPT